MSSLLASAPPDSVSVLVIEDTPEFTTIIRAALGADGYDVVSEDTGEGGLEAARRSDPDVIVLDLVLPGIDGLEVCRQLREFTDAYIIILTSRADEVDKVLGLSFGADDYLTKPFSARELSARIAAMLRRPRMATAEADTTPRSYGAVAIDPSAREATVDGESVHLTKIEFDLLDTLCKNPGTVHSRELLLELVWGTGWYDHHVVDVHVANLRKKIDAGRDSSRIKTVRGVGFRMAPEPAA